MGASSLRSSCEQGFVKMMCPLKRVKSTREPRPRAGQSSLDEVVRVGHF